MPRIISYSLKEKDEPTLQQLEIHLQYLSQDRKAAIAIVALYEATVPTSVDFDHVCDCCPKLNEAIALLHDLSKPGLLAVARAITEELAVLEQLQGVNR